MKNDALSVKISNRLNALSINALPREAESVFLPYDRKRFAETKPNDKSDLIGNFTVYSKMPYRLNILI